MTGGTSITQHLPNHSISRFTSYVNFIKSLLKTAIVHEFYYTLLSSFSPSSQPENLHTNFYKRINDALYALIGGLYTAVYNVIMRWIYTPFALLFSVFSFMDFIIHLAYALIAIIIAILLNISYLIINNLIIHVLIHGFATHTFLLILGVFALIDGASLYRLYQGICGTRSAFGSLYELLSSILFYPLPIILGKAYLKFECTDLSDNRIPSEDQCLSLEKISEGDENCVYGIDCNLVSAAHTFTEKFSEKIEACSIGITYILSTPFFTSIEILIFLAIAVCVITKIPMSFIQVLFGSITNIFFKPKPSSDLSPNVLLLASLRNKHEKEYEKLETTPLFT